MGNKTLTISVAAYNAESYLERCLNSFINSKVTEDLEIFVINDGSTDNTEAIAKRYEEKCPHSIRLINKKNGGHGSTINESIKNTTAKYFKIVDADDWVDVKGIENLVDFLKTSSADLVINPYLEVYALDESVKKRISPNNTAIEYGIPFDLSDKEDIMLYMHSLTFRSEVIKQMGPIIDENCFYVDMEYSIFPVKYINSAVYLEYPVYNYLLGTATQSMNMQNIINRREQHLNVTKRLIEYYESEKDNLCGTKKSLVCDRIKYAVLNQYKIYFHMNSYEGKQELLQFDKWVKSCSKEIYIGPQGHFMQIVKINRKLKFSIFRGTVWILDKMNLLPCV